MCRQHAEQQGQAVEAPEWMQHADDEGQVPALYWAPEPGSFYKRDASYYEQQQAQQVGLNRTAHLVAAPHTSHTY